MRYRKIENERMFFEVKFRDILFLFFLFAFEMIFRRNLFCCFKSFTKQWQKIVSAFYLWYTCKQHKECMAKKDAAAIDEMKRKDLN